MGEKERSLTMLPLSYGRLAGKRAWYFGDSIMAQDQKVYTYPADYNQDQLGQRCHGYPTLLREAMGIQDAGNFAAGGATVAQQLRQVRTMDFSGPDRPDLVIIAVGCNDFSQGTPLGTLPLSTQREHDDSFIGSYCALLDHIFTGHPTVKAVLMTPLHRSTLHRSGPVPVNGIDLGMPGPPLRAYADAIREIGAFYACPVADMYRSSGLNRMNLPLFTFEGVHPTNDGYRFAIGPLLEALLKL